VQAWRGVFSRCRSAVQVGNCISQWLHITFMYIYAVQLESRFCEKGTVNIKLFRDWISVLSNGLLNLCLYSKALGCLAYLWMQTPSTILSGKCSFGDEWSHCYQNHVCPVLLLSGSTKLKSSMPENISVGMFSSK